MSTFANLDEIAVHLRAPSIAGEPPRIAYRRDEGPSVEIYWDDARDLVWIRAPLGVVAARFDPRDLAVAIATMNTKLEVFGVEYDTELAFVSHVFFDAEGKVSRAAIERLLRAVDECAERVAVVVAGLAVRGATPA